MSETASSSGAADIAAVLKDYVPRADYEAALQSLNETIAERDTHKTTGDKHSTRITELEGKLRGKAAREAFGKVAEKLKIDPDFRDHVFELAKIPADADEPDLAAVEQHAAKFIKEHPRYVKADPSKPTKIDAGEGSGRGRSVAPGEPELRVTRKQMGDAVYMRENQSRVSAAAKQGLLVIDDN